MPIEVGAAPYYEAAATRKTTLGRFAAAVAHNPGTVREQLQEEQQARAPPGHAEYLFVGLHGNGASSDRERAMQRALETALEARLPPVLREALERNHLHSKAWVQFSLGPAGAGSGMHYHVAALNTLAYGRKHWTLLPPRDAVYSATPVRRWHALGGPARSSPAVELPGWVVTEMFAVAKSGSTVKLAEVVAMSPAASGANSIWKVPDCVVVRLSNTP